MVEGLNDYRRKHPSKVFDNLVLILIVASSITLVLDNPLNDPEGNLNRSLVLIDVFFTVLFTIEASIKIIAKGFVYNKIHPIQPYIRSYWN